MRTGAFRGYVRMLSGTLMTAVLLLVACGNEDLDGDKPTGPKARFEVLEAGVGQPNTEPLWPMRVGMRWRTADGECAVSRKSDRHGPEWYFEQCTGSGDLWESFQGWNMGRAEAFWSVEPEGLVLRSSSVQEVRPDPLLILPARVARGMTWQDLGSDGTVLLAGSIDGGDFRDTAFGRRRVWAVHIDLSATDDTDATSWDREFVEGRGPNAVSFALVPLEERTTSIPSRVAMTPTGQQIPPMIASVRSFSALEDPATGLMEAHMGVYQPAPGAEQNGPDLIEIRPRRTGFKIDSSGQVQPLVEVVNGYAYLPHVYDFGPCQDAAATAFVADGSRMRIPMSMDGVALHGWSNPPRHILGTEPEAEPIFAGALAGVYGTDPPASTQAFVAEENTLRGTHPYLGDYDPLGYKAYWVLAQGPYDDRWGDTIQYGQWTHALGGTDVQRVIATTPLTPKGIDVVMRLGFLMSHATLGNWWLMPGNSYNTEGFARDSAIDGPYLDEVVAVLRPNNSRDLYEVSEDGLIWRLRLEEGALNRYFIAAVQVPDGQRCVGVVPLPDGSLQVWTEGGYARNWSEPVFGVGPVEYYVDNAQLYTYTIKVPEPEAAEPVPAFLGLEAQASGRDVLLCVPPGRSLPDTPWTLGGQPAHLVRQSDRCLLLVRSWDPEASQGVGGVSPALIPTAPGSWVLTGELPEIGPVELALVPSDPEPIPDETVHRAHGGFAALDLLAGPGLGYIERSVRVYYPTILMDLAHDGYWTQTQVRGDSQGLCQGLSDCTLAIYFDWDLAEPKLFALPWDAFHAEPIPELNYVNGLPALTNGQTSLILDPDLGPIPVADPSADGVNNAQDCAFSLVKTAPTETFAWQCGTDPATLPIEISSYAGPGVQLPAIDMTFYSGMVAAHVWRIDWSNFVMDVVPVPHADHFPSGAEIADGSCAADGACFLLLRSPDASHSTTAGETLGKGQDADPYAEGKPPVDIAGSIPWSIVRVDRTGLGLHEVTWGYANSTGELKRLRVDDKILLILDAKSVTWRGRRDQEPTTCEGCSLQEACLWGLCDCTYRSVLPDGTCADEAASSPYSTCAAALESGVSATTAVRIDNDGEGPAPAVVTRCDDPAGWTPVPARLDLRTAWMTFQLMYDGINCYPAVPPYQNQWQTTTSEATLHGEFEVRFSFGDFPTQGFTFPTWLALDTLDHFDPLTGLFDQRCSGASRGLAENEVVIALETNGTVRVNNSAATSPTSDRTNLRLVRDIDGFISLYQEEALLWKSDLPMKHDYRMVAIESAPVHLESVRWKGHTPSFCVPQCGSAVCGPDGCDGTCGECGDGGSCSEGQCACNPPLYGDGVTCLTPTGSSAEFPASSCIESLASPFPWNSSPWIDTDGPGFEPPFHQTLCIGTSPWVTPPSEFLGPDATLLADSGAGTCQQFSSLEAPPANPASVSGGNAHLDGLFVPAGQFVAATFRALKNQWSLMVLLTPGQLGERAAIYLDDDAGFDPVTLAWLGWRPECGGEADLSHRLALWRDSGGTWAQQGEEAPVLILPHNPSFPMLTLTRQWGGPLVVTGGGATVFYTSPQSLPNLIRVVAEVQGGSESQVILLQPMWQ